jgi:hypothetical protein
LLEQHVALYCMDRRGNMYNSRQKHQLCISEYPPIISGSLSKFVVISVR